MEIIYSATPVENAGGRKIVDPKDFEGPVHGARKVYCDMDNSKIRYGYETRNVEVLPISKLPKSKPPTKDK